MLTVTGKVVDHLLLP